MVLVCFMDILEKVMVIDREAFADKDLEIFLAEMTRTWTKDM